MGRVRLTAVPVIINRLLISALPRLLQENSRLALDLIAEPRDLSPAKRKVDLAVRLARPVRVNDAEGLVGAVEQGIGKSLLPAAIGDRIAGLVRLDKPSPPLKRELWLPAQPDLRGLRRVRVVADWVQSTLNSARL